MQGNCGPNWNYDTSYTTQATQQGQMPNQQIFTNPVQQQNWFGNQQNMNTGQSNVQQQRFVIPGRLVNDISEVQIGEIPMDGSFNVFPLRDLSGIYLKFWDNDGQFKTRRYILADDQTQNVESQNQMDDIMSKITSMEKMVKTILKQSYKNNQKGGNDNAK